MVSLGVDIFFGGKKAEGSQVEFQPVYLLTQKT